MLPEAAGPKQHVPARGHSFSLHRHTLGRQITGLFFSCSKLVLQITNVFVYATLSLNRLTRRLLTICKKIFEISERVIQIPDKEVYYKRYFSIYFTIVAFNYFTRYVSSPKLFFRWEISCEEWSFATKNNFFHGVLKTKTRKTPKTPLDPRRS